MQHPTLVGPKNWGHSSKAFFTTDQSIHNNIGDIMNFRVRILLSTLNILRNLEM